MGDFDGINVGKYASPMDRMWVKSGDKTTKKWASRWKEWREMKFDFLLKKVLKEAPEGHSFFCLSHVKGFVEKS